MKSILFATAVAILPTVAAAQDWTGAYGGLSFASGNGTFETVGPVSFPMDGNVKGAFVGYAFQTGNLVYGAELAYQSSDTTIDAPLFIGNNRLIDVKGRIGYATERALFFGVVGYTSSNFYHGTVNQSSSGSGAAFGLGVDYLLNDRLFVGAEYLHRSMHHDATGILLDIDTEVSTLSIRLGMKF